MEKLKFMTLSGLELHPPQVVQPIASYYMNYATTTTEIYTGK
jgi:hypothetical protein